MLLFVVEVIIAVYVRDGIIRPYVDDILVVALIYCAVASCAKIKPVKLILGVLLFSYAVEAFQYFDIVSLLGLDNIAIARIIIGTSFSWLDIFCYTLGAGLVIGVETSRKQLSQRVSVL